MVRFLTVVATAVLGLSAACSQGSGWVPVHDENNPSDGEGGYSLSTEPEREVSIRFGAKVGEGDFRCGEGYQGLGIGTSQSSTITPVDLRFYVHDVWLLSDRGDRVPVRLEADGAWQTDEVALLDFEDRSGRCVGTVATRSVVKGTAADVPYVGVGFSLGVPSVVNHADLISKPSPLNLTALWWSWNAGHKFFVLETQVRDSPQADWVGRGYVLHLGSQQCDVGDRGETVCQKPNQVPVVLKVAGSGVFDPEKNVVELDMARLLAQEPVASKNGGCHSGTSDCSHMFERLGINWGTGTYLPGVQSVFSLGANVE